MTLSPDLTVTSTTALWASESIANLPDLILSPQPASPKSRTNVSRSLDALRRAMPCFLSLSQRRRTCKALSGRPVRRRGHSYAFHKALVGVFLFVTVL